MIGKGKSITHTRSLMDYVQSRDQAIELDRNLLIGETPLEMSNEFKMFQNLNSRCSKNSFSFVISPSVKDGKTLSQDDYKNIARDFLKEINLEKNQYVAYLHQEKQHKHIHIVTNRVNQQGIAYKDNFIGKKSQNIAEELARTYKLEVAQDIQRQNELSIKQHIEMAHEVVIKQKPKSIDKYAEMMREKGIQTHMKRAKDGRVVGVKFQVGKQMINGSSVSKLLSAMNIQKTLFNIAKRIISSSIRGI